MIDDSLNKIENVLKAVIDFRKPRIVSILKVELWKQNSPI